MWLLLFSLVGALSVLWITRGCCRWALALGVYCSLMLTIVVSCRYAAGTSSWFSCGKQQALYAGPGAGYHVVDFLQLGDCMRIVCEQNGWACVCGQKSRGWLPLKS